MHFFRRGILAGFVVIALAFGSGAYPMVVTMAQEFVSMPGVDPWGQISGAFANGFAMIITTAIFALAGVITAWIKQKWNIDMEARLREIEAKHRDSLQSAIGTAVANLIAKGGLQLKDITPGTSALAQIEDYIQSSVPEAIEKFHPSQEVLAQIATKKALELGLNTIQQIGLPEFRFDLGGDDGRGHGGR